MSAGSLRRTPANALYGAVNTGGEPVRMVIVSSSADRQTVFLDDAKEQFPAGPLDWGAMPAPPPVAAGPAGCRRLRVFRHQPPRFAGDGAVVELQHPLPFVPGLGPPAALDEGFGQEFVRGGIDRAEAQRRAALAVARLGLEGRASRVGQGR